MGRLRIVAALLALLAVPPRVAHPAAGMLDPSFDGDGMVVTPAVPDPDVGSAGHAKAVVYQPDGKIVVAGDVFAFFGQVVLARYRRDGSLDPAFGTGGIVHTPIPNAEVHALLLQPDGKLVAGGTGGKFLLVRYLPDGSLDPTFGTGGIVRTPFGATSTDAVAA